MYKLHGLGLEMGNSSSFLLILFTFYREPNSFKNLCVKTNFTECNISEIPVYGTCVLRIRTESEKGESTWMVKFEPLRNSKFFF